MLAVLVCITSLLFSPHRVEGSETSSTAYSRIAPVDSVGSQQAQDDVASHPGVTFAYRFENARFYIPLIDISLNADGTGKLSFKQGESDDTIDQSIKLQPETVAKLVELITKTKFLDSGEDYQSKKDFSHLGWITITASEGEHHRTVRFNYTQNKDVSQLADLFRAIADQYIDLFHVKVAVEHEPLDLPAQMDALENDLQLERLAEPEQLIGPLHEMAQDDTLPLIARNHANRIITAIQKGKYKSPAKNDK